MPLETERETSVPELELMEKLGIRRTRSDYFHYGRYRYTNLKDAVAQAERDRKLSAGNASRDPDAAKGDSE